MENHSLHRQSGLTLIEILVAALILSVGLLSLAGLQVASLKSVQGATHKQQASFMIHELFERMRSNRDGTIAGAYNIADTIDCSSPVTVDCGGATACSNTEIATYDLYSIQCGDNAADAINTGAASQLVNGGFQVECWDVGGAADCESGVVVTFTWAELLSDKNIQDNADDDGDDGLETQTLSISATI